MENVRFQLFAQLRERALYKIVVSLSIGDRRMVMKSRINIDGGEV